MDDAGDDTVTFLLIRAQLVDPAEHRLE